MQFLRDRGSKCEIINYCSKDIVSQPVSLAILQLTLINHGKNSSYFVRAKLIDNLMFTAANKNHTSLSFFQFTFHTALVKFFSISLPWGNTRKPHEKISYWTHSKCLQYFPTDFSLLQSNWNAKDTLLMLLLAASRSLILILVFVKETKVQNVGCHNVFNRTIE